MATTEYEQASRLNLDLETRWASLFAHLARETGEAVESIVLSLNNAGREVLHRYHQDRLQSPGAQYSELHFLDFTQFVELASKRRAALDRLGAPPADWIARLNRQNAPLVRYRNALHHVGRFAFLPIAQQKEAIAGLQQQLRWLTDWFPGVPLLQPRPVVAETGVRAALRVLDHDERSALPLAKELGLDIVREPVNLVAPGDVSALGERLGGVVPRLYRVGRRQFGTQSVGLYLAYLDEWPERSAARDRYRRRLAAALTDHGQDARFLVVMLDGGMDRPQAEAMRGRYEVEVVYPRLQGGTVATVRAVIDVTSPTRYHVDLIEDLAIGGCRSVVDVQRRWNEAFSVEQVTRTFFAEIRDLRNAMATALLAANPDHPELLGYSEQDLTAEWSKATERQRAFQAHLNAFATRQVCRLLFLWFLQEKGWLGSPTARGSATFLFDLFRHRPAGEATYFSDVLVPLFFDGMGSPTSTGVHRDFQSAISGLLAKVLREGAADVPYLNGGLFRADADPFEARMFGVDDDGNRTRTVTLPDALFDPLKDKPGSGAAKTGQPRQRTVLGLLGRYRFTTQESTPDDQSVDPDPELLGRVFEDLYQADERHQTGAYYTPREVVRYMCRRALDGFLRDRTGLPQATLDALRAEAADWTAAAVDLSHRQQQALERALDEVTVVDPAVGSGAFLVGMLQEIVLLRRGVHAATTDSDIARTGDAVYKWKRHAITFGLFGVDINPTAVEICRLRLWLSLVIDYDPADLSRIPALPNLEFRIVAGDSLVDRMGAQPFPSSLPTGATQLDFASGVKMRQLEKHLEEFQDADDAGQTRRLPGLSAKIRDARREIALAQVEFALEGAAGKLAQLRQDKPKKPTKAGLDKAEAEVGQLAAFRAGLRPDAPFLKPLLWPVAFPQVFAAGGFDIVVANPPYVRQESLSDLDQKVFAAAFAEVYSGSADLYVFFFARALQILKEGGWLAFITSNKYMRAAYGQKLRAALPARTRIEEIVDFGDLPVFDVAAYPAVVVARKEA
ncbi:MAG: Eco57I restriction-modification methylase domain-containing protein, partial [Chloroflexia bacterium]|nr:Eco57I restriction-modification methylase domain-containing protein [Chloroflexia bacterium]